jgi:tetratricopeptide (TPR) repeat protein
MQGSMTHIPILSFILFACTARTAGEPPSDLDRARDLILEQRYEEAFQLLRQVASLTKDPAQALFYEAECLRLLNRYPAAASRYRRLIEETKPGSDADGLRALAFKHLYDIANFWLDDTRQRMRRSREWRERIPDFPCLEIGPLDVALKETVGKGVATTLSLGNLIHWDERKPWFNEEGRAVDVMLFLEAAEAPPELVEKALFIAGGVRFFNEAYREADGCFSRHLRAFPNSHLAEQALELALISKLLVLGTGPDDGRTAAEARELVRRARKEFPGMAYVKSDFLASKELALDHFESERALKKADACLIAGRREQARRLYSEVLRAYPGTEAATWAKERLEKVFGSRSSTD